jgi:hypothetical protein
MVLSAAYLLIAQKLQEAATLMSHDDIRTRLSDALRDAYKNTGSWCYIAAVFGDDQSGDVVYTCNGDLKKATYTCSTTGATVSTDSAVDVVPLTTYEVEPQLTEAGARHSSRDMAQLQAIHDHAIGLGAACSTKESALPANSSLKLIESFDWKDNDALRLIEATGGVRMPIKLIAPGKGASAFYPAEVLKRDGPNVFTKGTHIYINHATSAEESARPEGDWRNLAGALASDAYWDDNGKKGPGLYGEALFTSDHAPLVQEKASFTGMSIRASGVAESGKKKDGLPILKQLTHAESVDVVTRAGAGGMILTEAALPHNSAKESDMDEAAIQKLVESAVTKATAPLILDNAQLKERAAKGDAVLEATRLLEKVSLPNSAKQRVIESATTNVPLKEGVLDTEKFAESVNLFAKREGEYLASVGAGNGQVKGMGIAPATDPKEAERLKEAAAKSQKDTLDIFSDPVFGMSEAAAKATADRFKEAA